MRPPVSKMETVSKARGDYVDALGCLLGTKEASFPTTRAQYDALNDAFKNLAEAAEIYIRAELEPQIRMLKDRIEHLEPTK
jgi:hypothetical protein